MANVKIILRKEVKKDGTSPLAIRITKDRKSSYVYLEYSVKMSDWDKENQLVRKSHPNSARLNNHLIKKRADAVDSAIDVESNKKTASAKAIRQKIKPTSGGTVFEQADLYIERLKQDGKYNQYNAGKPRVKHLKAYLKNDTTFQDLTIPVIERYKAWLKSTYKMSERTAVNHLVVLRSIFSQAIKEGACEDKYYPFGKGKIKIKFPDSMKVGLTAEEIASLETAKMDESVNHARNLWLFSFYFAGMRVSDVLRLKWSDIQNDRLYYAMGKNDKGGSLKMPDKALAILKQYEGQKMKKDDFIFPDLRGCNLQDKFETQKRIATRTNAIDALLREDACKAAGIDKKLTMHIARHTFGNISGDKISIQMLQKLYRHSSITTTIGYQSNFIHKDADDALEAVIGG